MSSSQTITGDVGKGTTVPLSPFLQVQGLDCSEQRDVEKRGEGVRVETPESTLCRTAFRQ